MKHTIHERTIALAGLFQCAELVNKIASYGNIARSHYEICIVSLFKFDAENVSDIYNGQLELASEKTVPISLSQSLSLGLRTLNEVLVEDKSLEYASSIRYVLALIQLEKSLRRDNQMQDFIHDGLENLGTHLVHENHFDDPELTEKLANIYLESLATLPFRIQITGKMQYLQNKENEAKIRSLLLAGMRSAMLWQQLGGKRWHLVIFKKQIINALEDLRKS